MINGAADDYNIIGRTNETLSLGMLWSRVQSALLEQIAFKTPAPALTAQVNCAYAYARRQAMPTHGLQSIFKSKML
ncbi:hypothetical protein [Desulfocurvibacter africanus]|nr:hypothetical protein [Desulfocurvibacter africanus]